MKVFHYQYCVAVGEKRTVASSPDHFDRKNTKLSINTYITIPKFHIIFWCVNFVEMHSFRRVFGDLSEFLQKLEINTIIRKKKGNSGILRSDNYMIRKIVIDILPVYQTDLYYLHAYFRIQKQFKKLLYELL